MKNVKVIVGSIVTVVFLAGCSSAPREKNVSATEQISITRTDPNSQAVFGGASGSLAYSYESLEELEAASDVIAEVKIIDIHSADVERDSTLYNAAIIDLLKGNGEEKEIILKQVGVEEAREKTGDLTIQRDNPLMKPDERYVLFLKAGQKAEIGPLYYVAGEYQGKYEIQGDQVFSVNQQEKTKAMVAGQDLISFKEKIKRIVSENE
ncbi:hypothetical protein QPK24_06070 [Paenibacillus polygoni]|uniref:Lipoprotein n=1 Tax=Paenibacillus polygoni TaxID=3050112 RepID=A0ABY8X8H0_9BACL|nr:hypothetical protein [Paenibacillus polygoni]WIV20259.1 hypothetical protein QPK24_06070 [Paenibacillus polygoni]